jgi:4-diphosphocytidyl-2-C-methyl-D-erythritol kinase
MPGAAERRARQARPIRPMTDPARRLGPVVRLAPAKLNLTLAIVGRRPDGYHAIHSIMAPLGLSDRLSLAPAAGVVDTLHVRAGGLESALPDLAALGPPADNLVLRAIAAARAAVGGALPTPALAARLEKRIPVAAGLAGGSSDAAATLDGALEAWGAAGEAVLSRRERQALAARLGSDVPFFLVDGLALVEGRGEQVTLLPEAIRGEPPGILLVGPRIAVPTPAVFAAFAASGAALNGATRQTSEHLAAELRRGLTARTLHDRAGILASANDLLPATAAVEPSIVPFRRALARLTGRPIGLSGSGPTLWVLYPSLDEARAAEIVVRRAIEAGSLVTPGEGPAFIAATVIASPPGSRQAFPAGGTE